MVTANAPILALDASTEACSVALWHDGLVFERYAVLPRGHAQALLDMVDELLREAGVRPDEPRLVVYGRGPGAFTGVRIGVGVAQGLAFGADVPVYGVSTLAMVAQGCHRRSRAQRVLVAMDARMGEVYWACYALDSARGLMVLQGEEHVSAPDIVAAPARWSAWAGAGTGWGAYGRELQGRLGNPDMLEPEALPVAADALPFGREALAGGLGVPAAQAAPVYLRDRVTG